MSKVRLFKIKQTTQCLSVITVRWRRMMDLIAVDQSTVTPPRCHKKVNYNFWPCKSTTEHSEIIIDRLQLSNLHLAFSWHPFRISSTMHYFRTLAYSLGLLTVRHHVKIVVRHYVASGYNHFNQWFFWNASSIKLYMTSSARYSGQKG